LAREIVSQGLGATPRAGIRCGHFQLGGNQRFDLTANFVYIRLQGAEQLYGSGYDDPLSFGGLSESSSGEKASIRATQD
jgi:hypothetical protein